MRYNTNGLLSSLTGRTTSFLGGGVFLKNGVFRAFKTPTNPQTTLQMQVRATFSSNSSGWDGLTESERLGWEAAAASGQWTKTDAFTGTTRPIANGKQLYMFVNENLAAIGSASTSTAPSQEVAGTTVATLATVAAGAGTFTVTYTGALGANEEHLFTATPVVSPGVMRLRRAIARSITSNTTASPATIAAPYVAKFGAITGAAGQKVFVVVEAINNATGQRRVVGVVNDIIAA